MKIKILKDIPGYKAGEYESDGFITGHEDYEYSASLLVKNGFAEYIKDDIDIEAIRKSFKPIWLTHDLIPNNTIEEINFIEAYRIIKAVTDQLNGDWKPDYSISQPKFYVYRTTEYFEWRISADDGIITSIIPKCKDRETAEKVIELCESELKVLFGVK